MLDSKTCCLVLIDVQEKLLRVMHNPETTVKNCSILIQIANALDIPVLWCQQYPVALGPTSPRLTENLTRSFPIDKRSFSCCGSTEFTEKLHSLQVDTAVLCGVETHVCVFQTAMDLLRQGLKVQVIADAVDSRSEQNKQIALNRLAANGVVISSTEMLLFELLRTSEHPQFKALSALIR